MFLGRNGTTFLDNTNFQYKCSEDGGWHDFFSGEEELVPWSETKERATGETCARYSLQKIDEIMYNTVQTKPDLLDFIGVKKVWKYRPWVQEFIDQQLEKLAEQKHPTMGFHIRGGDKVFEDKFLKRATTTPLDTVQTFAQTYPKVRGGTCVVIGDEHAKVTEAAKAAERHLKCKSFRSSPFWRKEGFSQDMHNKEGYDVKCGGTVKMLIDMELLAHSDYMVASDHSKWAKVLQYLRYVLYEHDRSSFVDASSEHNDLYSAIRKFIRPNAFDVHHEGHHKEHKAGAVPAAEATVARKKAKKMPKATPAPTKPPKAAVADDEEEYDYEEEEE
ncbi:hypothetical protein COCSUDRAFT_66957 [Coccomyxa subellipsoidea C-169]|uniref:O-fucosyltransferase family protein n=1 Tax=Coccomyxa subellipsoidea (strain C-169) TaxID=574566 RepID=I0YT64_COCSC|nr:hypothetical protein COCSUDRAFT_66957 [Coccomyxa subellipsoidea C-169]EIE21583.1 hypothetical protein COCSUDRAFT_66957 [Coccomyxa subellipsoidea C-169]|eukprot:XP_005646127.1 hypothetical protein COCSUDRAFT_66957 [Coccomyxa subellipsoidea C-169]